MDLFWQNNASVETLWQNNMLSRLIRAYLPRSKCLLITWLQSPSKVILEPPKIKSLTVSIVSPSICHEVMGPDAMILVLWMLSFKPTFSFSSFTFIKRLFSSSSSSAVGWCHLCIWDYWYFSQKIPACASFSLVFCMMYTAYKLNKQEEYIQHWCTPFTIWKQSVFTWPVLTVASWLAYRFLRRHVRWSGIPIPWGIFQFFCDPHSQRFWHSQ